MAKQDVTIELFYPDDAAVTGTGAWHGADAYTRDPVVITRGRSDESGSTVPSTCTLTLRNLDGSKNPRNPASPLYGRVGRNTPIRVKVGEDESPVVDAFGRTVSGGWGTADSGETWSGFGAGGTVDASDFEVAGGLGKHYVETDNAYRVTYLGDVSVKNVSVLVTLDMTITTVTGNAVEPGNILLRGQSITEYYMARVSVDTSEVVTARFFHSTGGALGTVQVVPDLTFDGSPLKVRAEAQGRHLRMKVWLASGDEPTSWHAQVADDTITTAGWVGIRSGVASGNTNTKPVEFDYDDLSITDIGNIRFVGEVASWKPRRTLDFDDALGRGDAWTEIEAAGILRRLGQGKLPVYSPMRRTVYSYLGSGLLEYWPCEDEAHADVAASAIAGRKGMTAKGTATFAAIEPTLELEGTFRYGTAPYVDLKAGGSLIGKVPAGTSSPVAWAIQAGLDTNTDTVSLALLDILCDSGTYRRFRLRYTQPGTLTDVIGYDSNGTPTTILSENSQFISLTEITVDAVQNGANIDFRLWTGSSLRDSASVAGTLGRVTDVICNPDAQTPESTYNFGFAHIQVWDTQDSPRFYPFTTDGDGDFVYGAFFAQGRERADDRLTRTCEEAGITLEGPAATKARRMGPQPDATLLDLIRQAEEVGAGIVEETRDALSLTSRPVTDLLNQTVTLTLDYDAGGIAPPLDPAVDDLRVVNDFTAKRDGGSSARVILDEGPLSVQPPPDGVGVYDSEESLNFVDDTYLANFASWQLRKATVNETRYASVTVDLDAAPDLVADASAVDIGDVIAVTNLPAADSPDDVRLIVRGYTETIGSHRRTITFNCTPARPYDVGIWASSPPVTGTGGEVDVDGRYDSAYSTVAAQFVSGTNTSLSVAVENLRKLWVTGSGAPQFPLDILVSGVRLRVTAISGSSSPQTFTVQQTPINGVAKTIPFGTEVRAWLPARWAL